jgi:hypothetical protein
MSSCHLSAGSKIKVDRRILPTLWKKHSLVVYEEAKDSHGWKDIFSASTKRLWIRARSISRPSPPFWQWTYQGKGILEERPVQGQLIVSVHLSDSLQNRLFRVSFYDDTMSTFFEDYPNIIWVAYYLHLSLSLSAAQLLISKLIFGLLLFFKHYLYRHFAHFLQLLGQSLCGVLYWDY